MEFSFLEGLVVVCFEHNSESSGSIKCWSFLEDHLLKGATQSSSSRGS
jgi:hypothetical protein